MASWATIGFGIGMRSIERAYGESRKAFEGEIADWEARWQEHLTSGHTNAEGGLVDDEDGGDPFDYGEHVGEMIFDAEEGLRLIREAFAMTLYHFWEKTACRLLGVTWYAQDKIFTLADADPRLTVDKSGLNRLRLIVNCIKHDTGLDLYADDPALFDLGLIPEPTAKYGWSSALKLRDQDLNAAFAAVWASGPKSPPTCHAIEEVEL